MADIDPNILIGISTQIATIDERTKALQNADIQAQSAADHRHKNMMQAIESFVPRREIEGMNAATRSYAEGLAQDSRTHCDTNRELILTRVSKVEDAIQAIRENGTWIKRTLIGALISTAIGIGAYAFHIVFAVKLAIVP